jgi:PAS domain S-box-containing protein
MPARRSIADICTALAESAALQGFSLLTHLLNIAGLEARSKQAVFHEPVSDHDVRNLLIGAWDWDVRTDLVYADPKVASYFGLDSEEAYNGTPIHHWIDAIHSDDRDRVSSAIRQAMESRNVFAQEYRVMTTSGLRWVFARGKCICDADNIPMRFPGALIDITHEKPDFLPVNGAPRLNEL